MSNTIGMSLEERIVQKLKDDTLMQLIGDEDAITDLVKRALHLALFAERKDYRGNTEPSPVTQVAKEAAQKLAARMVDQALEDETIRKKLFEAIVAALPTAIENYASYAISSIGKRSSMDAMTAVQEALRQKGFGF